MLTLLHRPLEKIHPCLGRERDGPDASRTGTGDEEGRLGRKAMAGMGEKVQAIDTL